MLGIGVSTYMQRVIQTFLVPWMFGQKNAGIFLQEEKRGKSAVNRSIDMACIHDLDVFDILVISVTVSVPDVGRGDWGTCLTVV